MQDAQAAQLNLGQERRVAEIVGLDATEFLGATALTIRVQQAGRVGGFRLREQLVDLALVEHPGERIFRFGGVGGVVFHGDYWTTKSEK